MCRGSVGQEMAQTFWMGSLKWRTLIARERLIVWPFPFFAATLMCSLRRPVLASVSFLQHKISQEELVLVILMCLLSPTGQRSSLFSLTDEWHQWGQVRLLREGGGKVSWQVVEWMTTTWVKAAGPFLLLWWPDEEDDDEDDDDDSPHRLWFSSTGVHADRGHDEKQASCDCRLKKLWKSW